MIRLNKQDLAAWRKARVETSTGITQCGDRRFKWGERTYVMGIVNVSPDSFSGDGLNTRDLAVVQGKHFADIGVDIIDVGGESTRPNSSPISVDEELRRVIPVLEKLSSEVKVPLSIDTYKYDVARRGLDAGACILNDIWGLKADLKLAQLAAERSVPIILMSNQRDESKRYIVPAVIFDLKRAIDQALKAGIGWDNIIIDPGIGFGKTLAQNLELVRRLKELKALGRPILLGTSRKSMIGLILDLPVDQRIEGTAASIAIGIAGGADMVRVHDVPEMMRVSRMSDAIVRGVGY